MSGDAHVRICESLGVKFPRATRLVVSIAGEKQWLWRAVDQNGFVLDVLVQRRRDTRAAQRLMKKLLKSAFMPPRVMITTSSVRTALRERRWAFAWNIASIRA